MSNVVPIILVVLLVIVAAVIVISLVRRYRSQHRQPTGQEPVDPFHTGDQDSLWGDPRSLQAGDIVELRGTTYTVRGSLRLSEGGWTWAEHLLDDAKGTQVWLGVEEDPELSLSLWSPLEDSPGDSGELRPGASRIEFRGRTYTSEESGSAHYRSEATTGLQPQGMVRYHDYEAEDGSLLGFEAYGDADWEASQGEELSRYDVRIYPASA
ncbi:uncharacterized protein DUF4178 [Halopolyspora algeriensis]|uniref:Uncharacterized protein DUF4178 n=1 Tax=Halopolyspora algeriensis TaxID=1500506 RepID=A0A368VID1_9ACTN|nr:DUF4178 domain-containing protein [Halopolyspora algeriensis]RCW40129.1 uncharacterized protein DUF4178 [Halopolyspora algeriensis]TQM46388.1 uncharacterized protein DUF4178 [Halopolyspora algeriensis]